MTINANSYQSSTLGAGHQCDWRLAHPGDPSCSCERALSAWFAGPIHKGTPAPAVKYVTNGGKAYKS